MAADWVLDNGHVVAPDFRSATATGLAVAGGRIVAWYDKFLK